MIESFLTFPSLLLTAILVTVAALTAYAMGKGRRTKTITTTTTSLVEQFTAAANAANAANVPVIPAVIDIPMVDAGGSTLGNTTKAKLSLVPKDVTKSRPVTKTVVGARRRRSQTTFRGDGRMVTAAIQPKGRGSATARPIRCVETGEVFESGSALRRTYGLQVHSSLKDPNVTSYGYHWEYVTPAIKAVA